jgi:hypothetical protein
MRRLTNKEFIDGAIDLHGDKYSYDKCVYVNAGTKVIITCPTHGDFEQRASAHVGKQKTGCPKCNGENRQIGLDLFLSRAKEVHGDKFDYSLVTEYKANRAHFDVICRKHGVFKISGDHHIKRKQGCPKCKSLNLDGFIEKANKVHNNKYDYTQSIYVNNKAKIDIICPIHGLFNQRVTDHINGKHGCPECTLETIRLSTDEFIIKASEKHKNKYYYIKSDINFKSNKEKVPIICPIHGVFMQMVNSHLNGSGCDRCNESKGEINIGEFLTQNNIRYDREKKFKDCKYKQILPFDFYLPDYNTCIEFQGRQHYEFIKHFHRTEDGLKLQQLKDKIKAEYCLKNNIPLIVINSIEEIPLKLSELFINTPIL